MRANMIKTFINQLLMAFLLPQKSNQK